MMFYSKTTGGFYDEAIHGEREVERVLTDPETGETLDRWMEPNPDCKIPADAVAITVAEHRALFEGQAVGKIITATDQGYPVLQDPPAVPFEVQRETFFDTVVRPTRDKILNPLVGMGWAADKAGDQATVEAIMIARQSLLDITKHPTVLAATTIGELDDAAQAVYKSIVASVPASVRTAFKEVIG